MFSAMRRRSGGSRSFSVFAFLSCLFACVTPPAAADILSPYVTPSNNVAPFVLSTRSSTQGVFTLTLTPEQLADPHGGRAFIVYETNPVSEAHNDTYEVFVTRVVEIAVLGDPALQSFALRYANGSIELATPASDVSAAFEYSSEWLHGPYAAMANGASHLCLLLASGFVQCRAADAPVTGFNVSSGMLMEHRSAVRFKQIAAANCFTCGLRAEDSKVECFGDIVLNWLAPPPPVRIAFDSSLLQYSVIAAEQAGGWCGLTLDAAGRDLYCWSASSPVELLALPAPAAPLFWSSPVFSIDITHGCAFRSDGMVACNATDDAFLALPPFIAQTPLSEVTQRDRRFRGAAAVTGNVVENLSATSATQFSNFAFTPLRLIGVDAAQGNDTLCNSANTLSIVELRNLVPCATLAGALQQSRRNTWIQFLPGSHFGGDALIGFVDVTLASVPPSCLLPSELAAVGNGSWAQRMTQAAASHSVALLNCTGHLNCLTSSYGGLSLIGLSFTGSSEHAILHRILPDHLLPEFDCVIQQCTFFAIGGVLQKNNGRLLIQGCAVHDALPGNNVHALLDVYEVSMTMQDSRFERNYFPSSPADAYFSGLRTCVSIVVNTGLASTIDGCVFADNRALSGFSLAFAGGVAIQVSLYASKVSILRCNFTDQSTESLFAFGGAIGVYVPLPMIESTTAATLVIDGCNFERCSAVATRHDGTTDNGVAGGGGCIAVTESDPLSDGPIVTGAAVAIRRCRFRDSWAYPVGGAIRIGSAITSLAMESIELHNCSAQNGGGIWMGQARTRQLLFGQSPFTLTGITAIGCSAVLTGGSMGLQSLSTLVQLGQSSFTDSRSAGTGGSLSVLVGQNIELADVKFARSFAGAQGGSIYVSNLDTVDLAGVDFIDSSALLAGGAIYAQFTILLLSATTFTDCHLIASSVPVSASTSRRAGGAIRLLGGSMLLLQSSFVRCSALPTSLDVASCADSYDAVSGISAEGTGGSLSLELSSLTVSTVTVTQGRACAGGFLSMNGADTASLVGHLTATDMEAWSGSVFAIRATSSASLSYIAVNNSHARSNGGAIVLTEDESVSLTLSTFFNVSCTPLTSGTICDGGGIWVSGQHRVHLDANNNSFADVTAAGAGAVLFRSLPSVTAAALANVLPLPDVSLSNVFVQSGQPPFAQYGPIQASSIMSLTSQTRSLRIYPGELLDDSLPIVAIVTLDAFGQPGTMDRSLVVAIEAVGAGASAVSFAGTILQKVQAASGAANFSGGDLSINAPPGNFTLRFSVVSLPDLIVDLALSVSDVCPSGLYYSVGLRSCVPCASDLVAYNATSNACEQCPAGWQRSAPSFNATGGPLNDGVFCEVCPLGSVSTSGSRCAPCPPNTYQPTLFAACVPCSDIAGLACAGDGLAQVQTGYFALSVPDGAGGALIETFQCPEGFCSAAKVQRAVTDTAVTAELGATSASSSAINAYDQCAFPRQPSPSNLLCGECVEGYRPWGNRCAKCDSADGGLLFGLIILSLVLLGWLLRASLDSPSAGHTVVVLYFVQTAMLELGSLNNLLAWLNVVLFSPNAVGRCIAPLSPYQQTQGQILIPLALWVELLLIALLHFLAFKRWGTLAAHEPTVDVNSPLVLRVRASALDFISRFSIDIYISATFSLLLFSYTQVAVACVSYLSCVDVGGVSVVFSQPSMRCQSAEYARTKVLVIIALALYVAGFPIGVAAFLWKRSDAVREAHSALAVQVNARRVSTVSGSSDADDSSASASASSSSAAAPSAPVSGATSRFLRRYAPLFAMYSSSAWFWQVIVLARRTVFVVISVTLLPTPRRRFVAFALSTLFSLLLQLFVDPFRMAMFNRAEAASHSLLIVLSITLTLEDPPFSVGVNAFIFLLVVPPLCIYAVWATGATLIEVRSDRERLFAVKEREQMELEAQIDADLTRNPSFAMTSPPQTRAAMSIEMSAPNQVDSSSDRARL